MKGSHTQELLGHDRRQELLGRTPEVRVREDGEEKLVVVEKFSKDSVVVVVVVGSREN